MNDITTEACELAALGFRVFPCRPNDKRPAINAWPQNACADPDELTTWSWFDGEQNLAVACGSTAVGVSFFVVDIDIKDDQPGKESWADFCEAHPEVAEAATSTVMSSTPSGGWHLWFVMPDDIEIRNGRPFPGVDIRGEGGYVLVPTSKLPSGEYAWVRDPWEHVVLDAPAALIEALTIEPSPPKVQREVPHETEPQLRSVVVLPGGDVRGQEITPFEWLNSNYDAYSELVRLGWQPGGRRGNEEQMIRPGKNGRDGTSATFHHDSGLLNIYSTSVDPAYEMVGIRQRDCITLKPADIWMVANGITDRSEASRVIRRQLMPEQSGAGISDLIRTAEPPVAAEGGTQVPTGGSTPAMQEGPVTKPALNLPDEFWESRPLLGHIRQAAHSRMASADAILGAVLARYSATVPVTYRIPAIVMSASTFDHMSVLVSESSGGKSGAASIAKELFPPVLDKVIRWDQPVGSGEGLVELFYDWVNEENDKGKVVEVHKKVFNAVHFTADEGMALVQVSRRDSTTIGSVLCSAWSGTQLGQANASRDRKRIVEAGTGRVSGVCGIQLSLGHHFLADEWVRQGLSGRLVFFAAEDPSIPHWEDMPDWPGPLELPIHPIVPTELTYDPEIISEVREEHWQRTTGKVHEAPIDGHARLAKLKISGILALMDGRDSVSLDDWHIATQILSSSNEIRSQMLKIKSWQERDESHRRAIGMAETELVRDEHKERKAIARMCDSIIAKVPEDGIAQGKLRKLVTSSGTRHRFEAALAQAIERGAVDVDNGTVKPA